MSARDVRRCACGCGASLAGKRADAKYLGPDHKAEAHRRLEAELPQTFDPDSFWRRTLGVQRFRAPLRAA